MLIASVDNGRSRSDCLGLQQIVSSREPYDLEELKEVNSDRLAKKRTNWNWRDASLPTMYEAFFHSSTVVPPNSSNNSSRAADSWFVKRTRSARTSAFLGAVDDRAGVWEGRGE
jgi:hypothetical protein